MVTLTVSGELLHPATPSLSHLSSVSPEVDASYEQCWMLRQIVETEADSDAIAGPEKGYNLTFLPEDAATVTDDGNASSSSFSLDERLNYFLLSIVNPTLCIVGLAGNTLNVVVMSRRRMRTALDGRMERAARTGLVSLAAADILCCAVTLIITMFGADERTAFRSRDLADHIPLFIKVYGPYVQNTVAKSSTWLTVVTAVGRYFAICRPLHARHVAAEPQTTRVAVVAAFVGCALVELPTAWTYVIVHIDCRASFMAMHETTTSGNHFDDVTYLMLVHGPFGDDRRLRIACMVVNAVVGFLLPAAILSFCTWRLVAALRESARIGRCYHADVRQSTTDVMTSSTQTASNRGRRLTVTLVAIVAFYLLLVSPSELLHMLYYAEQYWFFEVAIPLANVLQTINFSLNFVLYCAFNAQFRATCKHLIRCDRLPVSRGGVAVQLPLVGTRTTQCVGVLVGGCRAVMVGVSDGPDNAALAAAAAVGSGGAVRYSCVEQRVISPVLGSAGAARRRESYSTGSRHSASAARMTSSGHVTSSGGSRGERRTSRSSSSAN